jgi:hypothetical protein
MRLNTLARSVTSTSSDHFTTAFFGLLAPYRDPCVTGLLVGVTSYTTVAHIACATRADTVETVEWVDDDREGKDRKARRIGLQIEHTLFPSFHTSYCPGLG